jgi:hypothetical protein
VFSVARLDVKHETLLETLDVALSLTENIRAAYCVADPTERRLFNQAFFERLEVDSEEISGHQLAEPYAQLLAHDLIREAARPAAAAPRAAEEAAAEPEPWDGAEGRQEAGDGRALALVGAGAPAGGGN